MSDEFCRWNEGRFVLDGSTTKAGPDLRLTVDALGSAYLGGFTFADLARAGRVEEAKKGAVARADAFSAPTASPGARDLLTFAFC